ncbi:hypothetical protein L218DRAFT_946118 [Marasmius fiardii PR-910]|nr:hypothetical protein L218DRAFT_946118 [Marasmius fiardii PR-910]
MTSLIKNIEFGDTGMKTLTKTWVDALEKAVPKYDQDLNQVGFYAPKCKPEDNQVEASEVQQPGGDTLFLDRHRVGLEAEPSHTREETQDSADISEREVLKIGTSRSKEGGSKLTRT